jgi:hypothetical protein
MPVEQEPASMPLAEQQAPVPEPYDPTIGELMRLPPVEQLAAQPDQDPNANLQRLISDDPFALPPGFKPMASAGPDAQSYAFTAEDFVPPPDANIAQSRGGLAQEDNDISAIMPRPEPEFIPPDDPTRTRWTSRISILEAYQYNGSFKDAPHWVNRTWLAYGDADILRGIPAGPCLRVPLPSAVNTGEEGAVLCRVGDFICRQQMDFEDGRAPHIRTEVWAKDQFLKNFMPAPRDAPRSALPDMGSHGQMGSAERQRRKA